MPAEWEPHEGTWLQWPQDKVYSGYELKLERIWLNMVETLHDHENVPRSRERPPHRQL